MTRLCPTAEMTLGPFFPREFAEGANELFSGIGSIEISGRITELDGKALDNVIVEIWQADAAGRYDGAQFVGWGRAATDAGGEYRFRTIRPGALAGRAPHINFLILYSGLMRQLQTVMFFESAADPVFLCVPERRRAALIARKTGDSSYRFDIRLRGADETPFFDD